MSYDETWATIGGVLFKIDVDALCVKALRGEPVPWDDLTENGQERFRRYARKLIAAMEDDLRGL